MIPFDIVCIFHDGCTDQIHVFVGALLIFFCTVAACALLIWIGFMIRLLYELKDTVIYQRDEIFKLKVSVDYLKKKVRD